MTDYLNAEYSILDFNVGATASVKQAFDFDPQFEIVFVGPDGEQYVFDLGDEITIDLPDDLTDFELNPFLRLKNDADGNFSNVTSIHLQPIAELAVLGAAAGIQVPNSFQDALGGQEFIGIDVGPLVGTIDSSFDLIPETYPLGPGFTIDVFNQAWNLGGFGNVSLGSIEFIVPEFFLIPGGDFENLDAWQTNGNVVIESGMAKLTTASPVSIATSLLTPDESFLLQFDYEFLNPTDAGILSIFLDGFLLDSILAGDTPNAGTHRILVDDPTLLGRADSLLLFEYFDVTGSTLLLDNVQISTLTQATAIPAPQGSGVVPEPLTCLTFAIAGLAFVSRRRLCNRAA